VVSASIAAERRTSPVELLWDLVFVFAVTQISRLLADDLSWAGFGRSMLALALVWWAWSAFVWAANAQDPESAVLRGVLFTATVLIFVAGVALPQAFDGEAAVFALAYAGVRLLHLALYVDASRRGNASLGAIAGFAVTVLIGMGLLVAGALLDGAARVALWVAAALIDYAGPAWLTRERLRGLQQVAVAHFAERYGLFVIICLGESIVAVGLGAAGHELDAALLVAVVLGMAITIALWWTYFDRSAARAERGLREHRDPVLAAADGYSYLHLVIVAGIIVFAVGAEAVTHRLGEALSTGERLALCGGVALYLAGLLAFAVRVADRFSAAKAVAAAACLALVPLTAGAPAWASAGAVAGVLFALVAQETVAER
jgi:low temperature requirement protein LtrA